MYLGLVFIRILNLLILCVSYGVSRWKFIVVSIIFFILLQFFYFNPIQCCILSLYSIYDKIIISMNKD